MTRLTKQQADAITARNRASWRKPGAQLLTVEVVETSMQAERGAKKPSKYRNVKTVVDGTTFDSKKEAAYFQQLTLRKAAGEILGFVRQVSVPIGKSKRRLRLDFVVFNLDGTVEWIDVKGMQTPSFQIKRDELEANTPIRVRTV